MSKQIMLNVTILLVITLQIVHTSSLHKNDNERDKRDLLDELEELLNHHRNRTKTCGPSVSLEKLQLLKEKMENVSALMDEIYVEAEASEGSEVSAVYANCADVYKSGHKESGIYMILNGATKAYCNMDIEGGGWSVFQHRFDGSVDFYRTWAEYRDGFGDVNGEYWLGLENLHQLTADKPMELYIQLEEFDGSLSYVRYGAFSVGSGTSKYTLRVSKYSGSTGDGLKFHNKMAFSTKDRDNDKYSKSCSKERGGGWWYNTCMMSNLNGKYQSSAKTGASYGFSWYYVKKSYEYFLKGSMMMMRPASF